jgi:hypothetical protein
MTLKRWVGYGKYMDAEEMEKMEVDKHVERAVERCQKIDDICLFCTRLPISIFFGNNLRKS